MIGWYVWVWTADNLVFMEPIIIHRTEYSQKIHVMTREEDVIDDSFKIKSENTNTSSEFIQLTQPSVLRKLSLVKNIVKIEFMLKSHEHKSNSLYATRNNKLSVKCNGTRYNETTVSTFPSEDKLMFRVGHG